MDIVPTYRKWKLDLSVYTMVYSSTMSDMSTILCLFTALWLEINKFVMIILSARQKFAYGCLTIINKYDARSLLYFQKWYVLADDKANQSKYVLEKSE